MIFLHLLLVATAIPNFSIYLNGDFQ